ncbi:hypothetical protein [Sporisorium scitamineum]|uniref:BZIP domain-containing protein n=1 Tax=Sporisorium scitamineum TaxID=49012 RepID=A0A0F7S4N6_9BASI|nr:hypothetical protein [Sporisorium scitamineum]
MQERGAGKQRTRNAQAQADLRVRRKNYIKTLEDTVLSLEACVRQLRAQNAELTRRTSTSFDLASSSSNVVDADEKEAFRRDEEWQELKAENARLYAILAKAGLIDETSGREDVAESSTCSTLKKATPSFASSKEGKTWSSTCFITTKKHKLSKMQEFAQQVDSQLSGVGPDSSSSFTTTSPPQEVNYQAQQAYPPFTDKNVFYLPDPAVGLDVSVGDTPSSSRSSRGESVTSHRSPKTPRFESTLQDDKEMLDSTLAFDASSSAPMSVQAQAAWYETPIVLAPVSTASMGSAQVFAQEPSLLPLPQQVDAWMIRQLSTSAPPSTVNVWPLPFQASEYMEPVILV